MNKIRDHLALKLPIYLIAAYLVFTLIVYITCPYDWPTQNPVLFYTLNVLYIAAVVGGYFLGQKCNFRWNRIKWSKERTEKLMTVLSVLIIVNVVFYLVYIFRDYGYKTPNFIGLIRDMSVGLRNPGLGYLLHLERLNMFDGPDVMGGYVYTLLSLLWSFLKYPVLILSLIYFKKLKIYGKIFTVVYLALVVLFYISIGTNIQFLHVLLLIVLPFVLSLLEKWYRKTLTLKTVLITVAVILACVILLLGYFGWMMESRSEASGYDISQYPIAGIMPDRYDEPTAPAPIDPTVPSAPLPTPAPEENSKIKNLWISVSSYLTQGYYGMSQALSLDWTPMFGFGNSMFVVDMVSSNLFDIDKYTYQVKLEPMGWDSDVRWHTMYMWLANDVSFYGVIAVMLLIGFVFGMMYKDAIKYKNAFAKASMFFYVLMFVFIPCNNQLGQSNETLFAFLLLVAAWFLCSPPDEDVFELDDSQIAGKPLAQPEDTSKQEAQGEEVQGEEVVYDAE